MQFHARHTKHTTAFEKSLNAFLQNNGAVETDTQIAEEGWWLGRYDKDEMTFENKQIVAA